MQRWSGTQTPDLAPAPRAAARQAPAPARQAPQQRAGMWVVCGGGAVAHTFHMAISSRPLVPAPTPAPPPLHAHEQTHSPTPAHQHTHAHTHLPILLHDCRQLQQRRQRHRARCHCDSERALKRLHRQNKKNQNQKLTSKSPGGKVQNSKGASLCSPSCQLHTWPMRLHACFANSAATSSQRQGLSRSA